jgi:tetratricopeptide (TPR) repeat protein
MDMEISEQEWILRIAQAASQGREGEMRDLLTQCLQVHPGSGRANYLMAAELAEAGEMDGALVRFAMALEAEPQLHEARLQWALLLLTLGRVQAAIEVLEGFASISAHPALQAFQLGLRHVAAGELKMAAAALRAGLALRHPNEPLANDMGALTEHVEQSLGSLVLPAAVHAPECDVPEHFLVRAYDSMTNP